MTPRQSLWMVELPLALPVIMAGIRTAAVWVIGTATLSTPIGQTSLGNYIFAGLQTQNWVSVLFGCAAAAVLALAVDQLLALIESGLRQRSRARILLGGLGVAVLIAAALVPPPLAARTGYVVGAKTFTEQYVLSALIAERLRAAGLPATTREGLGSSVIFEALANNEIDVYVDYSGTLWTNQLKRADIKSREALLTELTAALKQRDGIALIGGLGFENAYALVMPRARAEALGVRSIADLAPRAGALSIAGDYEFFSRPNGRRCATLTASPSAPSARCSRTSCMRRWRPARSTSSAGYTSDGLIAKYDLVVLDDPRRAIPPYDAVVLVAPRRADDRALREALAPLIGKIDIAAMREANLRAAGRDGASAPDAVAQWLWEKVGKR